MCNNWRYLGNCYRQPLISMQLSFHVGTTALKLFSYEALFTFLSPNSYCVSGFVRTDVSRQLHSVVLSTVSSSKHNDVLVAVFETKDLHAKLTKKQWISHWCYHTQRVAIWFDLLLLLFTFLRDTAFHTLFVQMFRGNLTRSCFLPCMYMHGSTLVYIYIYIYK